MATVRRYQTAAVERWEVRYRQPNGATSRKRGSPPSATRRCGRQRSRPPKVEGAYVSPARGRVTVGDLSVG